MDVVSPLVGEGGGCCCWNYTDEKGIFTWGVGRPCIPLPPGLLNPPSGGANPPSLLDLSWDKCGAVGCNSHCMCHCDCRPLIAYLAFCHNSNCTPPPFLLLSWGSTLGQSAPSPKPILMVLMKSPSCCVTSRLSSWLSDLEVVSSNRPAAPFPLLV